MRSFIFVATLVPSSEVVPTLSSMSILPLSFVRTIASVAITQVKLSASKVSDVRLVVSRGTTSAEFAYKGDTINILLLNCMRKVV